MKRLFELFTKSELEGELVGEPRKVISGFHACTFEMLCGQLDGTLDLLSLESGFSDSELRDRVTEPLEAIAEYVQTLPAQVSGAYRSPGGLFRYCVDSAFYSARRAQTGVYSHGLGSDRRVSRESSIHFAAMIAGMFLPVKAVLNFQVSVGDRVWNPLSCPLGEWLGREGVHQYAVRRELAGGGTAEESYLAARLVPRAVIDTLTVLDADVTPMLVEALIGGEGGDNTIMRLASEGMRAAIEKEARRTVQGGAVPRPQVTTPFHLRLLDGIRDLVANEWAVNAPNGALFWTDSGLLINWTRVTNDLRRWFTSHHVVDVPVHDETWLDCLNENDWVIPGRQSVLTPYRVEAPKMPKCSIPCLRWKSPEQIGIKGGEHKQVPARCMETVEALVPVGDAAGKEDGFDGDGAGDRDMGRSVGGVPDNAQAELLLSPAVDSDGGAVSKNVAPEAGSVSRTVFVSVMGPRLTRLGRIGEEFVSLLFDDPEPAGEIVGVGGTWCLVVGNIEEHRACIEGMEEQAVLKRASRSVGGRVTIPFHRTWQPKVKEFMDAVKRMA